MMNKVGREKFDPHRLAKLEAIGFDWNPLASGSYATKKRADLFPRINEKWMSWYNTLEGFKEKHGHIIVGPTTKNYPGLYNWIPTAVTKSNTKAKGPSIKQRSS